MQYILEHHLLLPPKLLALHRYRIDSPYMDDAIADEHKLRRCSLLGVVTVVDVAAGKCLPPDSDDDGRANCVEEICVRLLEERVQSVGIICPGRKLCCSESEDGSNTRGHQHRLRLWI
jgi:hypothetical protein